MPTWQTYFWFLCTEKRGNGEQREPSDAWVREKGTENLREVNAFIFTFTANNRLIYNFSQLLNYVLIQSLKALFNVP